MVDEAGGDDFLLLAWVLLEGEASMDGFGVEDLALPLVECLLERVRTEGEGEPSITMLLIRRRPPLYGIRSEQVSKESSPLLTDLGLTVQDTDSFFVGIGRFTTFTLFSQPGGNSPVYKYHPLSFSCHAYIANLLYFLAYATIDLVGNNNRGLTELIA